VKVRRVRRKLRLNRLELSGRLLELGALRYTPAGVAAIEFKVAHESEQDEAGGTIAFETQAKLLAGRPLGSEVKLQGFLSAKSKRAKKLLLHVTNIEFKEGEADASTS
jgi:primosomal replication protein N